MTEAKSSVILGWI